MTSGAAICAATILALAHLLASAPISRCAPADGVTLHLHLRSNLNATGHRVLMTSVESAGAREQQVEVDVTQREVELQGRGQLLALDAVAAVAGDAQTSGEATEPLGAVRPPPGAAPDADFEDVRYADYRALDGAPAGLYKVHRRALSWAEARAACEGEHAHLLVPETAAEARAAVAAFARGPDTPGTRRKDLFFVGLSDGAQEGHYVTVTVTVRRRGKNLTSLEFQGWHPQEPTKGTNQNGVALDVNSKLHDIPNEWKLGFVCEAPASAR